MVSPEINVNGKKIGDVGEFVHSDVLDLAWRKRKRGGAREKESKDEARIGSRRKWLLPSVNSSVAGVS